MATSRENQVLEDWTLLDAEDEQIEQPKASPKETPEPDLAAGAPTTTATRVANDHCDAGKGVTMAWAARTAQGDKMVGRSTSSSCPE